MEKNTVILDLETYNRLQEMEKNQKIVFSSSYYGQFYPQTNIYTPAQPILLENYQYAGKDEAIKRVTEMNEKLHTRIQDLTKEMANLRNPPPATPTPEALLFERLKKASRKQRREFINTGKVESLLSL